MSTCILTKTVPATLRNGGLHYIFSLSSIIISNVKQAMRVFLFVCCCIPKTSFETQSFTMSMFNALL